MTKLLSISARPDAPIACDLTGAEDTLAQRLAEYRRLFEHPLRHRDSTASETTFRFAARPGVTEWVLDLVQREAACCPFLSYEVDQDGEALVWVTKGVSAADMAVLQDFIATADQSSNSEEIARRLTDQGGVPIVVPQQPAEPNQR